MAIATRERTPTRFGGIPGAASIISAAYIVSRLLGILRQTAINGEFGSGAETDAFWAAFTIPDVAFNLLIGGALTSVFVPVYARLLAENRQDDAWRLACTVFNLAAIMLVFVALLIFVLSPMLSPLIAAGFPPQTRALTAHLTRILALQPLYLGLGVVATAVLNARKHFTMPALASIVYNVGIIVGAIVFAPRVGPDGLAVGVTIGALGYFAVQVPALRRQGLSYRFVLDTSMPELARIGKLLAPRTLGLASSQIGGLITMVALASALTSGSVTVVRNAMQLLLLPVGIIGVALSTAVFPTLADQVADNDWESLADTVRRTLRFMVFAGVPSTAAFVILGGPIVSVLLRHGRFGAADVRITSFALAFYGIGLCAHLWDELLPRVFYAFHDTMTPLLINLVVVAVNIVASAVLRRWLQVGGIGLGLSIAATFEALVFAWLLANRLPGLFTAEFWRGLARIAGAGVVLVIPLLWYAQALDRIGLQSQLVPQLIEMAGGAILMGITYLPAAMLLGCEDALTVADRAVRIWNVIRGE